MRRALVPERTYLDRRTKRRREEARLLAAERAGGAVGLAERTRRARQQALAHESPREHDRPQGLQSSSFGEPDPLPPPSPAVLPHGDHDYEADFAMDLDPIIPPPGLVDINTLPNRGLPTFDIDDELIQRGETRFFPIPLDTALPFIIKAQEDRHRLEETGGALPLSPGRAFQLNAMEKQHSREARKANDIAEAMEKRMTDEIRSLMASCGSDDEQEAGFGDDNSDVQDYAESGEDEISESDVGPGDNGQQCYGSSIPDSDEDQDWEEQLIDADYILQDAQYLDVELATQQTTSTSLHIPRHALRHPPSLQHTLYELADSAIEIDTHRLKQHPKVMVNRLGENDPDDFLFQTGSRTRNVQRETMDEKSNVLVFMISLLIAACVLYFQASRKQVAMLLKGMMYILQVAGCADAAAHIPGCTDTVYTFLDIDTTMFLVLPICPDCNDIYPHHPTGNTTCPRCNIPLYPEDLGQPNEPKATRRVRVPTYKLTMLLLSAQIEAFLNVQGIEMDVDRWRTVGQPNNIYTNVTNARVWNGLLDHEGKSFFRTEEVDGRRTGPHNEIRLGVHMAIDW